MSFRFSLLALGLVAVTPVIVTMSMACGGRVAGDPSSGDPPAAAPNPSGAGVTGDVATGTAARPTSTPTLAPCPADSTPLPIPADVTDEQRAFCSRVCERTESCIGCATVTCMPNCFFDSRKNECGGQYTKWMQCVLDEGKGACGAIAACDKLYCDYVRCNSPTGGKEYCP